MVWTLAPPQHPHIPMWTGLLHHLVSHGQGQNLNFSPPTLKAYLSPDSMSTFLAECRDQQGSITSSPTLLNRIGYLSSCPSSKVIDTHTYVRKADQSSLPTERLRKPGLGSHCQRGSSSREERGFVRPQSAHATHTEPLSTVETKCLIAARLHIFLMALCFDTEMYALKGRLALAFCAISLSPRPTVFKHTWGCGKHRTQTG